MILTPGLTGLVIAVLVLHVFPLARGIGVNQTKAALYIYNGYIPLRTAVGNFITAAPAIGVRSLPWPGRPFATDLAEA